MSTTPSRRDLSGDSEKADLNEIIVPTDGLFTEAQSKHILRKMDLHVLPIMWGIFTLSFMDKQASAMARKTNEGNAVNYGAIWGLKTDLHLVGQEFAWVGSIFFFGYLVTQLVFPPIVHRFAVPRTLSVIVFLWSVCLMCQPACKNFTGIMIQRFFLGLCEGAIVPAFVLCTSLFYTRQEQAFRAAIWTTGNAFGNVFGSLLGYGFGASNIAIAKWMLFPIVFGAISLLYSFVIWFFIPATVEEARFLNAEERRVATLRIQANLTGKTSSRFSWYETREAFLDPKSYVIGLIVMFNNLQAGGPSTFGSQIVTSFGFSALPATVLQGVPTGIFQAIIVLLSGYIATTYKDKRLYAIAACNVPTIIGGACLYAMPAQKSLLGAYIAVYAGPATQGIAFGFLSTNFAGYTKKTIVSTIVLLFYCVGQIAGPQFFKNPPYTLGFGMMMVCYAATIILALGLRLYLSWENKRRDRENLHVEATDEAADEQDLTDFQRRATFRYAL